MQKEPKKGSIEVIVGPMFSGKSTELLRRISVLHYAKKRVMIIKHKMNNNTLESTIVSRIGPKHVCKLAQTTQEVQDLFESDDFDVLAIDEVQFFDKDLVNYLEKLANNGVNVLVAGLDNNNSRRPWEIMTLLLPLAERVKKLHSVCAICLTPASYTFLRAKVKPPKYTGDADVYDARCRSCWNSGYSEKMSSN